MEIRKAARSRSKLRIGITSPSGGGKTYSALLLASGLTDWGKICVIDTENGSAELYSELGPYNVLVLDPPFSPSRYIDALKAATKDHEVIIIDSASHEWDGEGGCLDIHSKLGGEFRAWKQVTPMHRKFVQAILQCPAHIITTTRRKQDYAMVVDSGKAKVKKMGLKEIQREGFEYELTVNFQIGEGHNAVASKDRTTLFKQEEPFIITKETGELIKKWNEGGTAPKQSTVADTPKVEKKQVEEKSPAVRRPTTKQIGHMFGQLKKANYVEGDLKNYLSDQWGIDSTKKLDMTMFNKVLEAINGKQLTV
jgi:hypothetical protein